MSEIEKFDTALYTEITTDIQKDIAAEQSAVKMGLFVRDDDTRPAVSIPDIWKSGRAEADSDGTNDTVVNAYKQVLEKWMEENAANNNITLSFPVNGLSGAEEGMGTVIGPKIMRFPSALPLPMLPLLLKGPEVSQEDLEALKSSVFTPDLLNGSSSFICDYSTYLVTFSGKLTSNITIDKVVAELQRRMADSPGLSDRLRLLVLPDYAVKSRGGSAVAVAAMKSASRNESTVLVEKYSGFQYEPLFVIVSREALPPPSSTIDYVGGAVLSVATFATSFIYAVDVCSLNNDFLKRALDGDVTVVEQVLPIVFGVLALQAVRDAVNYAFSRSRGVAVSLPLPVPSLQIGVFGSFNRLLSFARNRKELLDVSLAGPTAGFVSSLGCILAGLAMTQSASPLELSTFPELPVGFFSSSFLLHQLCDLFLSISSVADPTTLLPLHPLVVIGLTGVLANALNFMPIGQLDGGRAVMSIFGRRSANFVSLVTLIAQALSLVTSPNGIQLFWIFVVVFFRRNPDLPPEDDVTAVATDEEDAKKSLGWIARAVAFALCVSVAGATLLPLPIPSQPIAQQQAVDKAQKLEGSFISQPSRSLDDMLGGPPAPPSSPFI